MSRSRRKLSDVRRSFRGGRSEKRRASGNLRKRKVENQLDYQGLEPRQVLNAAPIAQDDLLYFTPVNTTLNGNVLTNDFDPEGDTLTVSLLGDPPQNGQLTLNSDGTFQYVPGQNAVGNVAWNYRVHDGNSYSRYARVSVKIGVGNGLSLSLQRQDRNDDNPLHTGAQILTQPLVDGQSLNFRSDKQGTTVVSVETFAAPGTPTPTSITANLVFGGVNQGTVTYNTTNFATGSGNVIRFAIQAMNVPTGHHNWTMTVTLKGSGSGGGDLVSTFTGSQSVVNHRASEYGPGWWLDGLDRLHVQDSIPNRPDGILLVEGSGRTHFFAKSGPSSWSQAEGDLAYQTLAQPNGDYVLTDKWGNERWFNSDGLLISVHEKKDLTTPIFTYDYETASTKRLTGITDQFNRTFVLQWPANSNYRMIATGFGGDRQAHLFRPIGVNNDFKVVEGFTLNVIYLYDYVPRETTYEQEETGPTDPIRIKYKSQAAEGTTAESRKVYSFHAAHRLLTHINHANLGPNQDETHSTQISPTWLQGLRAAGSTPEQIYFVASDNARYIDELNNEWKFTTNRFGQVTSWKNPLNAQSTYEYNSWGELVRETGVDPDGGDSLVAPVTLNGYTLTGNLVLQKHLGGNGTAASELKWTYSSTLNRPLTAVNELNKVETMTYHTATGNLLTYTDRQGYVWSYSYDEQLPTAPSDGLHGRLRTITSPDPDGAGPLQAIVTTYEYTGTIYTLPTRMYNADSSYREWTYDLKDRVNSERDELGRQTTYVWDDMDRLRFVNRPTGATWEFTYFSAGPLKEEIDPLGLVTKYNYDARYRLVSQTLPDPDGTGGLLPAPVYNWKYNKTGQVVESIDPTYAANIKDIYQYDSAGRLTKHIGPLTAQYGNTQETVYQYDSRDRLTRVTDASGRIQGWEYDVRDRMTKYVPSTTSQTGPVTGRHVLYGYNAASQLISVRDELFRQTDYFYSDNGWLTKAILPSPDGTGASNRSHWDYTFDTLGRQTTVKNPLAQITTTAYDNRHRVASVTTPDPDGGGPLTAQVYSYQYDLVGNLKQINMPLSRIVQYDYDDLDRMIKVKLPHATSTNQTGPEWNYQYGLTGSSKVTQQTDPLGRITEFAYDNLYRQKTVTLPDPDGSGTYYASQVWQWNYDSRMLLTSVTAPVNLTTSYGYDNAGRTTSMTLPGASGLRKYDYFYDSLDRLTKVVEPAPASGVTASETEYTYDVRSRLSQVKDARNGTTNYAWNDANELVSLTDSVGNSTQWTYDRMGRKVLETNSLGFTRMSEYDKNSNLTRGIDRNGRITQYTLDALDRVSQEQWYTIPGNPPDVIPEVMVQTLTQGQSGTNEVQKVSVKNLSSSTPGTFVLGFNGATTAPLNWDATATQVRDALVAAVSGSASDFSVTFALVNGVREYTVTFTGANASKDVPQIHGGAQLNALPSSATRTLDWVFDDGGRLASTTDRNASSVIQSSYQFVYDQLNRMTIETSTLARLTPQIRMTRAYDAVGNRTSLLADMVVGGNVTRDYKNQYWFDQLNRVNVQTQTVQGTGTGHHFVQDKRANYHYTASGQVEFLTRFQNLAGTGQSLRTVSVYESGTNRLQTLSHRNISSPTTFLSTYAYSYDHMDRITQINHTSPVSAHADGISNFSYDKTSQLTVADHAPARPDENYQYDANGNRSGGSYQTGTNNQTSEDSKYTYLYDKEGNRTRRTDKLTGNYENYIWDHRNRLIQVVKWDATPEVDYVTFTYDTFNRLVFRQEVIWNPNLQQNTSVKDKFFAGYEGINPTLEFETAGTTWTPNATAGDLKHRLWWGQGVDQLLSDEQYSGSVNPVTSVGTTLWALADHLGTIRDIATFNGTSFSIANHRVFDSFGNIPDTNGQTNPAVSIEYRYTGKYFDAFTGLSHHWNRWYDPKLGKWISEDPIGFAGGDENKSRFVGNKVTGYVDRNGLEEISVFHLTNPENVPSIVQNGLKPGADGFIWTSQVPGKGLPETSPKTVGLKLDLDPDGLKIFEIGQEQDKQFSKLANEAKWGTKPPLAKSIGDIKWELITKSAREQGVDAIKVIDQHGNVRLGFTEQGWSKASPKLKGIFGKGAQQALQTLHKAWNNPEIVKAAEGTIHGKLLLGAKIGKRVLIIVGAAADLYEIYSSEDRVKTVVKNVGGWAGAVGGAKLGGVAGGALALGAGQMGPQVVAPEEIVTVPVAGAIGAIVGGIGGYFVGSEITETIYDWVFSDGVPADGIK